MTAERVVLSGQGHDLRRLETTLSTLTCPICGAGPLMECDFASHQAYANAQYPCPVCLADVGEICHYDCPVADVVANILIHAAMGQAQPPIAPW